MIDAIYQARSRLQQYLSPTPFVRNERLSQQFSREIYLKREDLQPVRSYKVRGALNAAMVSSANSFVSASAGNHAQGVAYACAQLKKCATIVMPTNTPMQKQHAVHAVGREYVDVVLFGSTYDEACAYAHSLVNGKVFLHPFDDLNVIAGQGTIGLELADKCLDAILVPIGGGGLVSGVGSALKALSPTTKVVGVQVETAASMYYSLEQKRRVTLSSISTFVDGVAVATPGEHTFSFASGVIDDCLLVSERDVCDALISLYNSDGIVAELAGALSVAAVAQYVAKYPHATRICCIVSGGNNDARRFPQILARGSNVSS